MVLVIGNLLVFVLFTNPNSLTAQYGEDTGANGRLLIPTHGVILRSCMDLHQFDMNES
jgi:hypothetical protein